MPVATGDEILRSAQDDTEEKGHDADPLVPRRAAEAGRMQLMPEAKALRAPALVQSSGQYDA